MAMPKTLKTFINLGENNSRLKCQSQKLSFRRGWVDESDQTETFHLYFCTVPFIALQSSITTDVLIFSILPRAWTQEAAKLQGWVTLKAGLDFLPDGSFVL